MLSIDGAVNLPLQLTHDTLRTRYTAHTVHTMYANEVRVAQATYTGALLWDVLQDAMPILNTQQPAVMRIAARSAGDYVCSIKWSEIDPQAENKPILIAYLQNGQPITSRYGPLRLAVPGDAQGQRYIGNLTRITVYNEAPRDDTPA